MLLQLCPNCRRSRTFADNQLPARLFETGCFKIVKLGPLHIYLSAAFFFGVSALMGVYSALLGGNPSDSSWHLSTALAGVIATITGIFLQRNARICLQGLIACWWILL